MAGPQWRLGPDETSTWEIENTMTTKWLTSTFSALAAVLCLAGALPASANQMAPIRVTVPFAFEAGDHAMPAGIYSIEHRSANATLILTSPDGERRALLTLPAGDPVNPKSPRLVFEKAGDTYRLAEVWVSGGAGANIPATKSQMLVAKTAKKERVELALVRK